MSLQVGDAETSVEFTPQCAYQTALESGETRVRLPVTSLDTTKSISQRSSCRAKSAALTSSTVAESPAWPSAHGDQSAQLLPGHDRDHLTGRQPRVGRSV